MGSGPRELAWAGVEHLDPAYVATYDAKAQVDVGSEVEFLRRLGVGPATTLIDFGAGTGMLAAAIAPLCRRVVAVEPSAAMAAVVRSREAKVECVIAGFLTYQHVGEAPDFAYSRNALHHLPDVWKTVALHRVARLLQPGGTFVLRDIAYCCEPGELEDVLEAWFAAAVTDPSKGWTRGELEGHVGTEFSTFAWLLEPILERAGFEIVDARYSDSRTYVQYVCTVPCRNSGYASSRAESRDQRGHSCRIL